MATPGGRGMPSRTISSRATTSAWTSMGSNSTTQDDKSSFVLAQDDQPGRVYRRAFIACHYTRRDDEYGGPRHGPPNPPTFGTPRRSRGALLYLPWNGGGDFLFANAVTPALKSSVRPELAMAWASSSICVSRLSHVDWWNSRLAP